MNDIVSTLGLHGLPELFRLPNDIDHFKGQKAVVAIMAPQRTHPEFMNAERFLAPLKDDAELIIVAEDQADGPLHERFQCGPDEFCMAVVDKEGHTVLRTDQVPHPGHIREQLKMQKTHGTGALH